MQDRKGMDKFSRAILGDEDEEGIFVFYLSSNGVAIKLANITVGALTEDPSTAIASPHRNTVTPVAI